MFERIKRFFKSKKGFSLVELIVVIAIMAILIAVLAPSLLQYVERGRAQKDNSAMSEIANAIELALADTDVYDEMLNYTIDDAHKGYGSANPENAKDFAETQRGWTITFAPDSGSSKSTTFILANGVINKNATTGQLGFNGDPAVNIPLNTVTDSKLYEKLKAIIGEKITVSSQTYRNSEYTVFVAMGTSDSAITVRGEWGGTNLSASDVGQGGGSVVPGGSGSVGIKTIKAGTYRFNDVLSEPISSFEEELQFTQVYTIGGTDFSVESNKITYQILMYDETTFAEKAMYFTAIAISPNVGFSLPDDFFVYSFLVNIGWDSDTYGESIQTITIPTDQEVSAEFYEWFTANATKQEVQPEFELKEGYLSGTWYFNDNIDPIVNVTPSPSPKYTEFDINFYILLDGEKKTFTKISEVYYKNYNYNREHHCISFYNGSYYGNWYYFVDVDQGGIVDNWDMYDNPEPHRTLYLGEEQAVDAELWTWFVANATRIG